MSMRSLSSRPTEGDLTTKAFGSSPAASSGTEITAASPTAGCVKRWASSSAGATCKPLKTTLAYSSIISFRRPHTLTLINSLIRSTMKICSFPWGLFLTTASSPVLIHPSSNVSLFAWSLLRYPRTTLGDLTTSSPGWSYPVISLPSIETILAWTDGNSDPLDPGHTSWTAVEQITVLVSVSPVSKVSEHSQERRRSFRESYRNLAW